MVPPMPSNNTGTRFPGGKQQCLRCGTRLFPVVLNAGSEPLSICTACGWVSPGTSSLALRSPTELREALLAKMRRERAYLKRRRRSGHRTQTDRDYEADLLLEAELVRLLEAIEWPAGQKGEPWQPFG